MSKIYYQSRLCCAPRNLPSIGRKVYIAVNMNPDSMGDYSAELYIDDKFIYQSRDRAVTKAFEQVCRYLGYNYETIYEEDGRSLPWECR